MGDGEGFGERGERTACRVGSLQTSSFCISSSSFPRKTTLSLGLNTIQIIM